MSDHKLLIILIVVIAIQCVVALTHPAYRYYRQQSDNLRADYLRFEQQVRDDFVPAITNLLISNQSGTKSSSDTAHPLQIISPKASTTPYPVRRERDDAASEKRFQGIKNEIDGVVGRCGEEWLLYVHGHILRQGDMLYGYPILGIDPCSVDIGCAIISVKNPEVKEDEQKSLDNIVVPYCPDVYGVGIL